MPLRTLLYPTRIPNRLDAAEALRRCELFRKRQNWSYEDFLEAAPELGWNVKRLRSVLSDPDRANITAENVNALNKFIHEQGINIDVGFQVDLLGGFYDYMYFALLRYLRYNPSTEEETKQLAAGLYRLYRPSLKIPDMFTVGVFEITVDPISHALCVSEIRRYKGDTDDHKSKYGIEGAISEEFHGYMVRKRRRYICLQRNVVQKSPNFLVTVFNDEFLDGHQEARIMSLGGIAFGTSGSRMYVSRVYIERCEDGLNMKQLKDEIDYVKKDQLRASVVRNLTLPNGDPYFVF
ncbi:hypothetical protein [Methylobacterium sp. P1-11]|uniref:hypothetical protein n=1 Tax=Methylobacterium sp. P1-11 TaxID=2024616 RepID=UPI0011EEEF3D|nr:hypothetical protein [Methylobacterium sp. P1-11]